jgi:hypothetical protein
MAPRNTINRITSRIDELTKRHPPELITIVGGDQAECQRQLEEIEAAGELAGRAVRFIMTGVPRAEGYRRGWVDRGSAADPT